MVYSQAMQPDVVLHRVFSLFLLILIFCLFCLLIISLLLLYVMVNKDCHTQFLDRYIRSKMRSCFLTVSHAPLQRGGVQAIPNFGVLLYLCLHPITHNDQIRHGITYGEGRVLGGQPRHCISTNASRGLSATAEFLEFHHRQLHVGCYESQHPTCSCL